MNILITGATGQLAWELQRTAPKRHTCYFLSREQLDISSARSVDHFFKEHLIDAVINAAAYTNVDKAEVEPDNANSVNHLGPMYLSKACSEHNACLLHISTDFVFDGKSYTPYEPTDPCQPLGVYGESKLNGEKAIQASRLKKWAIIRTSWVYSVHGNNFVKTMLRLMAEKPSLGIVGDQIGTPTWAHGLAHICWRALSCELRGIHHWSDFGVASWYDFAIAIQKIGLKQGLLSKPIAINPIASSEYPTPVARPYFSVLNKDSMIKSLDDVHLVHWQEQLEIMMSQLG